MRTSGDKGDNPALVAAALAGGPEEFGPIVERYQDAVFAVALARLRRFHDAEDVAQAAFLDAYERLDGLRDPKRLGAWLRSIAIHKSIDRLRRRREVVEIEGSVDEEVSVARWRSEKERSGLREEVMAAIGRLSRTQRETTTLYYVNGYSVEEVARIQEVPVGTVTRRLHDARERLKEEMVEMVEKVLRSEAPKPDFAARVFEIVNRRHPTVPVNQSTWDDLTAELRNIGANGVEGFVRALESPHGRTRAFAVAMICRSRQTGDIAIELIKRALGDPNRRVRRFAVEALLNTDVNDERKRAEFVPLVVPRLRDRSEAVRRRAAFELEPWAEDVPTDTIARVLLETKSPMTRYWLGDLLRKALDARKKES